VKLPFATILTILLGGACAFGSKPAVPSDAITPPEAKQVVVTQVGAAQKALLKWDVKANDTAEAGAAAAWDDANLQLAAARKQPPPAQPRPVKGVETWVAHQREFPAHFLARYDLVRLDGAGKPTSAVDSQLGIFVKENPTAAWKLVWYAPAPNPMPKLAVDAQGWAEQVPSTAGAGELAVALGVVAPAYAAYMNDFVQRGSAPSATFAAGPFTNAAAQNERGWAGVIASRGLIYRQNYSEATEYGNYAYRSADGGAVDFFTVREAATDAPSKAGVCVDQDPRQVNWGPLVPAGRYGSLAKSYLFMVAAQVPPARAGGAVQRVPVLTMQGGEVSAQLGPKC
jgi:hypothetical protein